jgi:hypothetical protein
MNDSLSSRWSVRLGSMVSRRVFGVGAVLTALAGLDADAKKKKKKKKKKKRKKRKKVKGKNGKKRVP